MLTSTASRRLLTVLGLASTGLVSAAFALVSLAAASGGGATGEVLHLKLRSAIHPVVADVLDDAIIEADASGAAVLILELDTPGGLLSTTHEITTAIAGAKTPVVVYVAPRGAHAASAGFFLLMAADVAAMAPETTTGAAAAVGPQGSELPATIRTKIEEDSLATIRAFAERHQRNVELATAAIREARSFSAQEALQGRLIDLVAADLADLVTALDGRTVTKGRDTVQLATAGRPVRELQPNLFQRILAVLATPDVAYLLLGLGMMCLMAELYTPGAILPGVVGAICLVLGFYGISVLPVNAAAVALLFLALLFFIAEIKVTSYGLLTVAGVVCLALGGMMLVDTPEPALKVSTGVIVGVALCALAVTGLLSYLAWRAMRNPVATGVEGMVGARGEVRSALLATPGSTFTGKVFVWGELWNAIASEPLATGTSVEVVAVQGLTLTVRPAP